MRQTLRAALLFILPTLALCVGMLEVGLRWAGRLPSNVTEGLFEEHGAAYRLKKNMTKVSRTPAFTTTIFTNELGLRDKATGPHPLGGTPYLAFAGDSITFGNGVSYEDSFVGVFSGLAKPHGLDVINLSVGGYHFLEVEELLYDFLDTQPVPPSRVAFVFTAQGIAKFEERYDDLIVKDGYLFKKDGWLGPYLIVALGNGSAAYCFFRDGIRKVQARLFPPEPTSAVPALELYARGGPWSSPVVRERFVKQLKGLEERVRRSGAQLVYVYIPTSVDLRFPFLLAQSGKSATEFDLQIYRDLVAAHATEAGVPFVDLTPVMQAEAAKGEPLSFVGDPHYNAAANHVIGKALFAALVEAPAPASPPSARTPPPIQR